MGRFIRKSMVRGVLLLALASVGYYLWNGVNGSAEDRWYGSAMVYMIIATNLITPVLLITMFSAPRAERLAREQRLFERLGQPDLVAGIEQAKQWTNDTDPMTHPLYHSTSSAPREFKVLVAFQRTVRTVVGQWLSAVTFPWASAAQGETSATRRDDLSDTS